MNRTRHHVKSSRIDSLGAGRYCRESAAEGSAAFERFDRDLDALGRAHDTADVRPERAVARVEGGTRVGPRRGFGAVDLEEALDEVEQAMHAVVRQLPLLLERPAVDEDVIGLA